MTTPSYSQWHRRHARAQRPPSWRERVWARIPRFEVTLNRPSPRDLAVIGSCAMLMLGSSSAAGAVSKPVAQTPADVPVQPADEAPPLDAIAVWRGAPKTYQVRVPAPGNQIRDVTFLADGRLAIRVLAGDSYQEWLQDPVTGERARVATCTDPCALAPDGTVAAMEGTFEGEKLSDISVSPSGKRTLIVTSGRRNGFDMAWLRWVDDEGMHAAQELSLVPIQGSMVWRPDEQAVALMVHSVSSAAVMQAGPNTDDSLYIGDSSIDGTAGPPVAPVSWSSDLTRHVFGGVQGAADASGTPLALFTPASATAFGLLIGDRTGIPPVPFGRGGMSPQWLPDGRLLAVGNDSSDLVLRFVDLDGTITPLEKLGIHITGVPTVPTAYAARWDLEHHRILVLVDRTDYIGSRDAYLVSYGG